MGMWILKRFVKAVEFWILTRFNRAAEFWISSCFSCRRKAKMKKKEKTNDWSQLPNDLINSIVNRLGAFDDFVALSSVCKSWRSVLLSEQNYWSKRCCVPWFLVCKYDSLKISNFLIPSLNKSKRYNVEPIITKQNRYWGSSIGWIFTLFDDNTTRLINPFTGLQITLPQLSHSIKRALVFANGDNINNNIFVFVIFENGNRLAFARPGFKEWITLQDPENVGFADVVCYKDRILGVRDNGALVMCETDILYPRVIDFALPPEVVNFNDVARVYLVESAGVLLIVLVRREFKKINEAFGIYKIDMDTGRWAELNDLGNCALFLGDNYSISVSDANGVDCIGNCIYYGIKIGIIKFYVKEGQALLCNYFFPKEFIVSLWADALDRLFSSMGGVWVVPRL